MSVISPIIDSRYWEYTLTELALYDIPAVVRYVLQTTKSGIKIKIKTIIVLTFETIIRISGIYRPLIRDGFYVCIAISGPRF